MASKKVTVSNVTAELWRRKDLEWKLKPHQVPLYKELKAILGGNNVKSVLEASRRWGKSFLLLIVAIEFALSKPGSRILYVADTAKQVRDIILPAARTILSDCPPALSPKWKGQRGAFDFKNLAVLQIAGADQGRAEHLRGGSADLIIVDEAGFIDNLKHIAKSILFPMTARTGGKMLFSSNAPLTPGHEFVTVFVSEAQLEGTYFLQTIYDADFTPEQIAVFAKESGGVESTTFRREYLCEHIIDKDSAILPEFTGFAGRVVQKSPQPPFFLPMVSIDLGFTRDFSVALFGCYDFAKAKIVIQDELVWKKPNSQLLVKDCKQKELELWGDKRPIRVADGQPYTLNDITTVHRYPVSAVKKDQLEAQVNSLRLDLQNDRLWIDPRCKVTISQCKNSVWNKNRDRFGRDEDDGHNDALASLVYFVRHVNRTTNPYPAHYNIADRFNTVFRRSASTNPTQDAIRALFKPRLG